MYTIKGNNINEIQIELFNLLKVNGEDVFVRNFKTKEIFPVLIHLTNIRNRCTTLVNRKWNFIFAIGELGWHLNGSNELNYINYYSKNWNSISEDRKHITDSCYGAKIFKQSNDWQNLISELRNDINTRRAVINLYSSTNNLGTNKPDVACTLSLQFLLRKGKLNLIVTMRSNDIIWGLPNDIFFFTMLQEYLAKIINVEIGEYYHQVASLHIYERHFNLLEKIIEDPSYFEFTMPPMDNIKHIDTFLDLEKEIRSNKKTSNRIASIYWQELIDILKLRSPHISSEEKEKIMKQSSYKELIKLCPIMYIRHWVIDS